MPFQKGRSGNPGGRPKVIGEIRELARAHTPAALSVLASVMEDESAPAAARVSAATALLDRGWGRPPQAVTGGVGPGGVVVIVGTGWDADSLELSRLGPVAAINGPG